MINVTSRQLADVRAALEEIVLNRFLPQEKDGKDEEKSGSYNRMAVDRGKRSRHVANALRKHVF